MDDGPLFIVDNSPARRNGFGYLREWSELAKSIDIASGFFEIGALLDLDGHWQKFDKNRILMGDVVSHRTKKAIPVAVRAVQKSEAGHLRAAVPRRSGRRGPGVDRGIGGQGPSSAAGTTPTPSGRR